MPSPEATRRLLSAPKPSRLPGHCPDCGRPSLRLQRAVGDCWGLDVLECVNPECAWSDYADKLAEGAPGSLAG